MSRVAKRNPVGWLRALCSGTMPQNLLLGEDLPTTLTTTTWTNRGSGAAATGVATPAVSLTAWPGEGLVGQKCAGLRSGTYFTLDDSTNYVAATPFTWVFAGIIRNTGSQRNLLFLGSTTASNWRGLYISTTDMPGVLSNLNGTSESDTGVVAIAQDEPVIVGVSLDAAGNLLIKQLTQSGETTLLSTTHTMAGTLTVNRFTIGTALIPSTSSPVDTYVRALMTCRGFAATSAQLTAIMLHFRDNLGCRLTSTAETPLGAGVDLVAHASATRIYDAKLQTSAFPTVNDLVGLGNGTATTVTHTKEYFDFANNGGANITSGYTIPSGTTPFTLAATVKLVSGRSWSSGTNYNLISGVSLGVTWIVVSGILQAHYNGVLYSSGVNIVSTWAYDKRYAVALTYDGTNLKFFINDMSTPVATHAVGSRTNPTVMFIGHFNGGVSGSWMHLMKNAAIFSAALTGDELRTHFRGLAAHAYRVSIEGDSNAALSTTDYVAPVGYAGFARQADRYVLRRAKLRTTLFADVAFSGRAWDDPSALSPTTAIANGATLDALNDAGYDNIAIAHIGTNDIHSFAASAATALADATTWYNARVASGKYRQVGAFEIPPSTNATFNGIINTYNAGLAGIFDFVIPRHADLGNPADGIHWLAKAGGNDAEHGNYLANYKQACQLRDALLNGVVPYHD